ncbi:MAG: hypothetical protein ABEI75_00025 [Halobaculum sp.]
MEVDHSPPAIGTAATGVAGAFAVLALGIAAGLAGGIAAVGALIALAGTLRSSRQVLGAGVVVAVVGVLAAGVAGAAAEPIAVGTLAVALLWDFGEHAVGLGEQLSADTDATRNVAVHAAGSVAVGAVTVGVGYGVFVGATAGQPLVALFFLLAGAVGLAAALR